MYSALLPAFVYLLVFVGALLLTIRRRKTRWPFGKNVKLLRGPGESLRKQLVAADEELLAELLCGVVGTIIGFGGSGWIAVKLFPNQPGYIIVMLVIVTLGLSGASAWRITRLFQRRSNAFVGWFGERYAADRLHPLLSQGYRIFHDVPFSGSGGNYNIDHIAVGPTGVTVIEVKTFRKRRIDEGQVEHEVRFDGELLHFPWGKRRNELDQVTRNADSLSKWILERTGLRIRPKPVLTFPSWYVKETPHPEVRVVPTDFLPAAIRGNGKTVLSADQVDLIARQLDVQCRDVDE